MAWNDQSRIARSFLRTALDGSPVDLSTLGAHVALFDDSVTPDANAELNEYGVGTWATGERADPDGGWALGGLTLPDPTWTEPSDDVLLLGAGNVVSPEGTSLDDVHGDLVYLDDDNRVLAFHAFGGAQAVTNGTFSVRFADEGVLRLTV